MAGRLIRIGVLGCGNVGASFVELVAERRKEIEARTGVQLEVVRIAVRNLARSRDVEIDAALLTNEAATVVGDPDVDVVVEVIGGIEPARELILAALAAGKPVVTANKELLANVGVELFEVAEQVGVDLLFEAAVAGGIPIMRGAAREPARRTDLASDGHRQRDDELHPHQDVRTADALHRRPRRGAATRLCRT